MKRISRSAIIEHSAADLYALVQDIEAYPEFLPWCVAAQVRERSPHRTVGRQTRLMAAASSVSPDWAQRLVVRRLSG